MQAVKIKKLEKALEIEDQMVLGLNTELASLHQHLQTLKKNAARIQDELASEKLANPTVQQRSWSIGWNEVLSARLTEIATQTQRVNEEIRDKVEKIQYRKSRMKSLEKLKMELTRQQQKADEGLRQIEDLDRFLNRDWNH